MVYAIVAVILLIIDQWLKYWTTVSIVLDTGEQALIPGVVKLVNVHNEGAAFSIMSSGNMRWAFVALAVVFAAALIVLMAKRVLAGKFGRWCAALAIAGALGNAIDRVLNGYVVDMFRLEFINFAVFNVADVILVISCLMFIVYIFVDDSGKKPAPEKAGEKPEPIYSNPKIGVSKVSSVTAAEESEPITDDDGVKLASERAKKVAAKVLDNDFWSSMNVPEKPELRKPAPEDEFDLESILDEFR